jgi:hypothetical protein
MGAMDRSIRFEKLSNEQRHERFWCAFTHVPVAWFFVALCAFEVFSSWRALEKPISGPNLFQLPFYILVVVFYTPVFFLVLRCFAERFVIGIAALHIAMAVLSWFVPGFLDPHAGLVGRIFLVMWVLAFLMSLSMPVQALRNPAITPVDDMPDTASKARFIWVLIFVVASLLLIALGYFIPSQ